MAGIQQVSFTDPYSPDENEILRRQALANALQQQSMQPLPTNRMAGRVAIPISPWEGAAKLAQGYSAANEDYQANKKRTELIDRYQKDYQQMVSKGLAQLQGTPATPGSSDAADNYTPPQAAVAPDPAAAIATFGSHPGGAALMPLAMQAAQRQQLIQSLRGMGSQQPQGGMGGQQPKAGMPQGGQMPQAQAHGVGGPAGGVPMEAWLAADPTGKSYMEALAKQNEPIGSRGVIFDKSGRILGGALSPGMLPIVQGPNGPTAQFLPNQLNAASQVAAAQAGAKKYGTLPYDIQTFNTQGAPTAYTGAQAIEQATGAPPPLPFGMQPQSQPQQIPSPSNFPKESSAENMSRGVDQVAILKREAADHVAKGEQVPPELQREIDRAEQRAGGARPLATRKSGLRLQDQGESAFQREYGGELAKTASKVVEGGDMGRRLNDLASAMDNARQQMIAAGGDVNKLAGVQQSITQMAQAFGIDTTKLGLPKDAGPMQFMDSITNRMAMGMIGPGGMPANNFSEADREFLINTMSKKTDTPEGFSQKLDLLRRVAKRNIDAEQSWLAADQQGISHSKWRQQWNQYVKDNPLYPKSEQTKNNQTGPTATGPNGQKLKLVNGQWVPM